MRKSALAATFALMIATGGAQAADVYPGPAYYAPTVVSAYSWMGPYLGANVGYEWGRVTRDPTRPNGVMGGVQGGYNWQSGQFVYGVEADLQLSAAEDRFAPWKFSNPWFGTLRGRAGFAMNNILFYGTFGLALGSLRIDTAAGASASQFAPGWTGGLGMEVGLTPNWSVKAEYLYLSLAESGFVATGVNNGLNANIFRLGVNYRF